MMINWQAIHQRAGLWAVYSASTDSLQGVMRQDEYIPGIR
jgi:hypothetical protein